MKISKEKLAWADSIGRSLARADLEKDAQQMALEGYAEMAGAALAKQASAATIGATLLNFAKKNPGVVIGGGLGLMNDGLRGAALGAGAGYGAQSYAHNHGLNSVGAAMDHGKGLIDKLRGPAAPTPIADELAKVSSELLEKEAFGAAIAGALRGAIPAITNFVKQNPIKAGLGALNGVSSFKSSLNNGEGMGKALLSGATGAASAAL